MFAFIPQQRIENFKPLLASGVVYHWRCEEGCLRNGKKLGKLNLRWDSLEWLIKHNVIDKQLPQFSYKSTRFKSTLLTPPTHSKANTAKLINAYL